MSTDEDNTSNPTRPIDAPLPPWTGRPDDPPPPAQLDRDKAADEEDTPTLTQEDLPAASDGEITEPEAAPAVAAKEDPRALARRLAEEAKRRLKEKRDAPPPADTGEATEQPTEVDEAPVQAATPEPTAPPEPAESPRDLARRLAMEAKQRMGMTPQPAARAPTPPAAEAGAEDDKPVNLSARASRRGGMSAAEALRVARERERTPAPADRRAAPPRPQRAPTPSPAPAAAAPAQATPAPAPTTPAPAAPPASAAPALSPAAAILELLPGAAVEEPVPVTRPDVFRALWRAHRTRALHEGDLRLAATGSVLLDALDRVPTGTLFAARITIGSEVWAVWVDVGAKVLLGAAQPADIYLAGL